ncbi:ferric reductase-like transmembrane domain-containing protein [Streptomyces sp. NPDC058000]|uniref:ferredoxin reductase family protein n=1 Tax=Streptomyces sp. NPDC058000 TaxID=3346299 RepID=UPI0036E3465D
MSTISHTRRSARGSALPHRLASAAPLLAQGAIGAGAVGVLALWWTGTASVVGPAGWLTGAGRITGLLAGYACAVLVALMARVPLLDHALGTDRLARWHATSGRYTLSLVLTHVLLIIWGYTLTSQSDVLHETTTLVLDYPDMLKATAGFLLLVGTGVLSARAARRRMSYETWHYLHFATYLALFLAFGHQLSNGADFVGRRPAQLGWYALYGAVAMLILWYRFVVPVRRSLRHRLRVADIRPEAPGVVSIHLTGERLTELGARPGQFFRWRFLAPGLWWTANPYSLSAPPLPHHLRITVKEAGGHSSALARLRPGTRVWAEGPYGAFTEARRRSAKVLLLAGGVGITPLRTLFETLPGDVTLIYRARRPEDLALRTELDAIAAARGRPVHYFVDEPATHSAPLTARALKHLIPDLAAHEVYLCGPPGMTSAARRALRGAGVPPHHIHHESFEF